VPGTSSVDETQKIAREAFNGGYSHVCYHNIDTERLRRTNTAHEYSVYDLIWQTFQHFELDYSQIKVL
jgi:hypothetical protein